MTSPAQDIASYLAGLSGLDLSIATNLFVSEMPEDPDFVTSIYDSGAEFGDPRYDYQIPRIQIRFRGPRGDYRTMYSLALDVQNTLDGKSNVEINGSRYIGIWLITGFQFLSYDSLRRPLATMNFRIQRTTL